MRFSQCACAVFGIEIAKSPISEFIASRTLMNFKCKRTQRMPLVCPLLFVRAIRVKCRIAVAIILAIVSVAALPAHADGLSLLVNGKALHIDAPAGANFNEENWGAGIQYDFAQTEGRVEEQRRAKWVKFINASAFEDSVNNLSWYAGGGIMRRYRPFSNKGIHVDLGVVGFLMYRKDFHDGDLFPGALPAASIGTERIALNITYIPKVDPKMVPLVFFQLKVGLRQFLKN